MVEVVDMLPMISGNSCQEFAVDIALHMSSSRIFTLMETMATFHVRTVVFYIRITVSTVTYLTQLHWMAI